MQKGNWQNFFPSLSALEQDGLGSKFVVAGFKLVFPLPFLLRTRWIDTLCSLAFRWVFLSFRAGVRWKRRPHAKTKQNKKKEEGESRVHCANIGLRVVDECVLFLCFFSLLLSFGLCCTGPGLALCCTPSPSPLLRNGLRRWWTCFHRGKAKSRVGFGSQSVGAIHRAWVCVCVCWSVFARHQGVSLPTSQPPLWIIVSCLPPCWSAGFPSNTVPCATLNI